MEALAHPATVHVPLALAVLFPFAYAVTAWAIYSGFLPKRIWYGLLAISVIQIGATLLAFQSGVKLEAYVVGNAELLAKHAQLGRIFIALWIAAPLTIFIIARSNSKIWWRVSNALLIALILSQLAVGIQLGKLGGALAMH